MRILLTGARGFIGRHVHAALLQDTLAGNDVHMGAGRRDGDYDLRSVAETAYLFRAARPEIVIHLACPTPGGIGAMAAHPTLCADMARIDANVVEACARHKVQQLITVGSVCSMPERAPLPATELDLFNGPPEATNAPYGEAKRFLWTLLQAYRTEQRLQSTYLVLSNVYGPGDVSQHVIPATIRKLTEAKASGAESITAWGDGTATRDLVYIDDVVSGIVKAIGRPYPEPIMLCAGQETRIDDLLLALQTLIDFTGEIVFDAGYPVGQQRRAFRSLGAAEIGWKPAVTLHDGLTQTVQWWKETLC